MIGCFASWELDEDNGPVHMLIMLAHNTDRLQS